MSGFEPKGIESKPRLNHCCRKIIGAGYRSIMGKKISHSMSRSISRRNANFYNFAVGSCDASTGLLLMFSPELVLRLLMITQEFSESVLLQFVGAFVFSTGATYFIPLLFAGSRRYAIATRAIWASTALVRIVVSIFIFSQILLDKLAVQWVIVAVVDFGFALVQSYLLTKVEIEHVD